jgi:transporter family-2 protein
MQTAILAILIGLTGGVAVALQGPLASLMSQRIGVTGSLFIIHLGGLIGAALLLLTIGSGNLKDWRSVPWYALAAGVLGLVVLGAVSYTIPRIGAAATVTLIVVAQLVLSSVLDHFGLLETSVRPIGLTRIIGMGVLFIGTWLMVR